MTVIDLFRGVVQSKVVSTLLTNQSPFPPYAVPHQSCGYYCPFHSNQDNPIGIMGLSITGPVINTLEFSGMSHPCRNI